MSSLEDLRHQLEQSQRRLAELRKEHVELVELAKREDEKAPATAAEHGPRSAAPLSTTLKYLEQCPTNPALGLPSIDPLKYLNWCTENDVAASVMLGRQLPATLKNKAGLEELLRGELAADDGPFEGGGVHVFSDIFLEYLEQTAEGAMRMRMQLMKTNTAMINGFKVGVLASWRRGDLRPVLLRNVMYHSNSPTTFVIGCHMLAVAQMACDPTINVDPNTMDSIDEMKQMLADGVPRLCVVQHAEPDLDILDSRIWAGAMRDHMALKYVPAMVTTCSEQGYVLSQNAASLACIGVHGADQLLTQLPVDNLPGYSQRQELNYLLELLGSQAALDEALEVVAQGQTFRQRVRVRSPKLLSFMQLPACTKVYHDVSISRLKDGVTGKTIFIVAEVDVSNVVKAERRVQKLQAQQRTLLKKILPQQVIDVLLEEKKPSEPDPPSFWAPCHGRTGEDGIATRTNQDPSHASLSLEAGSFHGPQNAEETNHVATANGQTYAFSDTGGAGADAGFAEGNGEQGPGQNGGTVEFSRLTSHSSVGSMLQLSAADVQRLSTYHNDVSILFTDIQGFTSMSQTLHPSQVMLFLNQLFSAFDALLEDHDVYKIETIGDCYMVCAGLFDRTSSRRASTVYNGDADLLQPQNSQFHALEESNGHEEAVSRRMKDVLGGYDPDHASKMMRFAKALVCTANAIDTPLGTPVKMRVGVHSGPIMTGVIGRKMPRFCCFGDTVNTASRMESTGMPGAIHASAAFQALTNDEPWVHTGGVDVKGKGHMDTYLMHYDPMWELDLAYE